MRRRKLIERFVQSRPIGKRNRCQVDERTCEIGIKICNAAKQDRKMGKRILSLFIQYLFDACGYRWIVLDINLSNKRAQAVYERLGFRKLCVNVDSWREQLEGYNPPWISG